MASENNNKNTASDKESSLPKGDESWVTIIIIITLVAYVLWKLISSPVEDIEVLVTDKNGTPGIVVTIFDASTDEVVGEGNTDNSGIFRSTIKSKKDTKFIITLYKDGYLITPPKIEITASGTPLKITGFFRAESGNKEIIFKTKNKIPGVTIFGENPEGRKEQLGKTGQNGILTVIINKSAYRKISFSYSLNGAKVFADVRESYLFDAVPSVVNLKAIPDNGLKFSFACKDDYSNSSVKCVTIKSNIIKK